MFFLRPGKPAIGDDNRTGTDIQHLAILVCGNAGDPAALQAQRCCSSRLIEELRFAADSPLEESGFEPSVPSCERVGLKQECECEPGDKDGLERGGHVAGTKGSNPACSGGESVSGPET